MSRVAGSQKRRLIGVGVIISWLLFMVGQLLSSFSARSSPVRLRLLCTAFEHHSGSTKTLIPKFAGNRRTRPSVLHSPAYHPTYRRRQRHCTTNIFRFAQESLKGEMTTTTKNGNDTTADSVHHSNNPQSVEIRARIVPSTDLELCGERLRNGELVAFPTETVYGLGCNALDRKAIMKVFEAKERPLTDPLITHITRNQVAYDLWQATSSVHDGMSTSLEGRALQALTDRFWPGPLTLVARAAPHVPSMLMADTGFVACRSPQHPVAIALIDAARVPIAAPSANKFGHVSPTRSHHVWDDLKYENVWIVQESNDGDTDDTINDRDDAEACKVGVESSVVKIEMRSASNDDKNNDRSGPHKRGLITLLRQGAVSVQDIHECLDKAGLADDFIVRRRTKKATDETVAHVAPGQTIRHYSPHIPSFVLSSSSRYMPIPSTSDSLHVMGDKEKKVLSTTVVIDFGGKLKSFESFSLSYRDLSVTGDSVEASNRVFETLRWAELVVGATQILFPEIVDENDDDEGCHTTSSDALTLALKDRLTRAASGVVIETLTA